MGLLRDRTARDRAHLTGWDQEQLAALVPLPMPIKLASEAPAPDVLSPGIEPTASRDEAKRLAAWACATCHTIYARCDAAADCWRCTPYPCSHGLSPGPNECEACRASVRAQVAARRVAKAEKVAEADYAGEFVADDEGDHFDVDVAGLLERFEGANPDEPFPEHVWGTQPVVPQLDLDDVLESLAENTPLPDDMDQPSWEGVAELRQAVDAFNSMQTVWCYEVDETVAVVVDPRHERERLARRAAEQAARAAEGGAA